MRLIDTPDVRELLAQTQPEQPGEYFDCLKRVAVFCKSIRASAADAQAVLHEWRKANSPDVAAAAPPLEDTMTEFRGMLAAPYPVIRTSADPDCVVRGLPVKNIHTWQPEAEQK